MKCALVKEMYGLPESDPRYAEVQAHLRSCFICRARWDDQDAVRRLIALKRYEQPAPGREARSLAAIHARMAARWSAAGWWQHALAHWYDEHFLPVRQGLAVAALLLALLGGWYLIQPAGTRAPVRAAPALTVETRLPEPGPAILPVIATGMPAMVIASSNREPARMNYGPGESAPVGYNY